MFVANYNQICFLVQSRAIFQSSCLQCADTTAFRKATSMSLRRYPGARIKHVPARVISISFVSMDHLARKKGMVMLTLDKPSNINSEPSLFDWLEGIGVHAISHRHSSIRLADKGSR